MPEQANAQPIPETPARVPAGYLYFVVAALLLCFGQYILWMLERWWNDEYYGHGLLVPIISGFLLYRKKDEIAAQPATGHALGLPLIVAGILMHLVATWWDVNFGSGFALIVTLFGAMIWLYGLPATRTAAFPLAYLAFGVPMARMLVDQFAQPLQIFSAQFGAFFATAIGIPTVREGTVVHIPEYTFEVAIVCSGLKSAIAMTALGALYAYMVDAAMWKRVTIVILSVPVALFANGSRIALTLILGRVFGSKAAEGFFHEASGMFVFIMALIGLFIVGTVLKCSRIRDDI